MNMYLKMPKNIFIFYSFKNIILKETIIFFLISISTLCFFPYFDNDQDLTTFFK
jgi:hypothetical protein